MTSPSWSLSATCPGGGAEDGRRRWVTCFSLFFYQAAEEQQSIHRWPPVPVSGQNKHGSDGSRERR